jgi:hypothetical protein
MYNEYDGIQDETDRFITYMARSGINIPVQGRTYASRGRNLITFELFVGGKTHIVSTPWRV